jgi:DNA-binding NarL/FixJ family response regulator
MRYLTEREHAVLVLRARGLQSKEIAAELSISPKTVATHLRSIHRKCGWHSKQELMDGYRAGEKEIPYTWTTK